MLGVPGGGGAGAHVCVGCGYLNTCSPCDVGASVNVHLCSRRWESRGHEPEGHHEAPPSGRHASPGLVCAGVLGGLSALP